MKKNCNYCYTELHERATICPECHNSQTLFGKMRSITITGFPILTAIISVGFAVYEKTQAEIAQTALQVTETELEVEQIKAEVAEEAVIELSQQLPPAAMTTNPDLQDHNVENDSESIEKKIEDIEIQQRTMIEQKEPLSRDAIRKLQKEKLQLRQQQQIRGADLLKPELFNRHFQ